MPQDIEFDFMVSTTPPKTKEALTFLIQQKDYNGLKRATIDQLIPDFYSTPAHDPANAPVSVGSATLADLVKEIEPAFELRMPMSSIWQDKIGFGGATLLSWVDGAGLGQPMSYVVTGESFDLRNQEVKDLVLHGPPLAELACEYAYPHVVLACAIGMIDKTAAGKSDATCLFIDVVVQMVSDICMAVKGALHVPRPCDDWGGFDRKITPDVPAPSFPSYPGGHSAVMSAMLQLLPEVTGIKGNDLVRLQMFGERIATNRERAGLHVPSDTAAGRALALHVVTQLREMANRPAHFPKWSAVFAAACSEW